MAFSSKCIRFPRTLNLGITNYSNFHTTPLCAKGNTRRLLVASGGAGGSSSKATSRRESVAQMRAAASRAKWEADIAEAKRLRGIHPEEGLGVFFSSYFEQKRWPFCDAVEALREAAVPEMFNCLENPLYAKVTDNSDFP